MAARASLSASSLATTPIVVALSTQYSTLATAPSPGAIVPMPSPATGSSSSSSLSMSSMSTALLSHLNNGQPAVKACGHLKEFKERSGLEGLRAVMKYALLASNPTLGLQLPCCFTCGTVFARSRLYACMECVYVCCMRDGHLLEHAKQTGHTLWLDLEHYHVYCQPCADHVYDVEVADVYHSELRQKSVFNSHLYDNVQKRVVFYDWRPNRKNVKETIDKHSTRTSTPRALLGLRGLVDLGNTSFMNSVLQALVHNPLVRNYFLADLHNVQHCKKSRASKLRPPARAAPPSATTTTTTTTATAVASGDDPSAVIFGSDASSDGATVSDGLLEPCLVCELHRLFVEMYSGQRAAFAPHELLQAVWRSLGKLAGYEPLDAFEFLDSLLKLLHAHTQGTPSTCKCIAHQAFCGVYRFEVSCKGCSKTTTQCEMFFHVPLVIPEQAEPAALVDALARLVNPSDTGTSCNACDAQRSIFKQTSFHMLPMVLCFQVRRFESVVSSSTGSRQFVRKNDTAVRIPLVLVMDEHLSPFVHMQRRGEQPKLVGHETFDLFAVVAHVGSLQTGRYVTYIRRGAAWMACEDATITQIPQSKVLTCQAYLVFFCRRNLDYVYSSGSP